MPRRIRIALLLCDTPLPLVQKDLNFPTYEPIFVSHLRDSLASFPDKNQTEDVELEVQAFDVVGEEKYPYEDDLKRGYYDAVMMTGSAHSAYDKKPWLIRLISFIKTISTEPTYSHLKIIGICFGMQVLAMALGGPGSVIPNPKGWEIGVYEVDLTEEGRDWFERVEGDRKVDEGSEKVVEKVVGTKRIHIQQMHKDHLPSPPPNFHLVGSSPKCPVQGIIQYFPSSDGLSQGEKTEAIKKRIRIVGLQGHPEFTPAIVQRMITVRSEKGVIDSDTTEEARRRSNWVEGGEGRGVIGWGIWSVLLG